MARKRTETATVTEDGRVTIPARIRRRLGISPGTNLRFRAEDGKLVAVTELSADPVTRVYGAAGKGNSDAVMAKLRPR